MKEGLTLSELYSNLDNLSKLEAVKVALQKYIVDKLNAEGYFNAKECIKEISGYKEAGNKLSDIFVKNKKLKVNEMKEGYPVNQLIGILNNVDCNKITWDSSRSIIYFLLHIKDVGEKIKEVSYNIFLRSLMIKCGLIDNSTYICSDGYIKKQDLIIKKVKRVSDLMALTRNERNGITLFFRGHENINFVTYPGIYRTNQLCNSEYEMYRDLIAKCPEYFAKCNSRFEILTLMQHYGLPTRLLDVTYNPLIALYFACQNSNVSGEVQVYEVANDKIYYQNSPEARIISCLPILSQEKKQSLIDDLSNDNENGDCFKEFKREIDVEMSFSFDKIKEVVFNNYFIMSDFANRRITNQNGAFVAFGLNENASEFYSTILDYRKKNSDSKDIITIPKENKADILKELEKLCIDKSFVYPEIDDVASYLKDKYSKI